MSEASLGVDTKVVRQMVKAPAGKWVYHVPDESVHAYKDADGNDIVDTYATKTALDGLRAGKQPRLVTVAPGTALPTTAEEGQVVFQALSEATAEDILDTLHSFFTRAEARAMRNETRDLVKGLSDRITAEASARSEADTDADLQARARESALDTTLRALVEGTASTTLTTAKAYTDAVMDTYSTGRSMTDDQLKASVLSDVADIKSQRIAEVESRMDDAETTYTALAGAVNGRMDRVESALSSLQTRVGNLSGESSGADVVHDTRLDSVEAVLSAYGMSKTPLTDGSGNTIQGAVVGTIIFKEE